MADELGFEWDKANIEHILNHDVTPEEVELVFANDPLDVDYDVIDDEERWTVVGHTDRVRVLIVVFTMRHEAIRQITAYEATKGMRQEYLKGL